MLGPQPLEVGPGEEGRWLQVGEVGRDWKQTVAAAVFLSCFPGVPFSVPFPVVSKPLNSFQAR